MRLKEGCVEEYKKRHDEVWPEIVKLLKDAGISDYSIFFDEETHTLFAVQKQAGQSSSQELGHEKIVQKWWAFMADIMVTNPDNSPVTVPLREVFHMD
jgi:L-rhamnose mutarotase